TRALHEELSGGGGRLLGVRHQIEQALIALVSDADDDLERVLAHSLTNGQRVKVSEVGSGATTAHDRQRVKLTRPRGEPRQRPQDAGLSVRALHLRVMQRDLEAELPAPKLVQEVEAGVALIAGDEPDAHRA